MKRFPLAVSALTVLAGLITSCASGIETSSHNQPAIFAPERPSITVQPGYRGDTLNLDRIGGGRVGVTLVQVINPATVAFGFGDAAKTYVAAEVAIKNLGTTTITGDANNNVALIGSDDHTYRADLATVTECKNFVLGQFVLPPQVSATGCVVFGLPGGVSPAKVRYHPSSGISLDVGEWIIS